MFQLKTQFSSWRNFREFIWGPKRPLKRAWFILIFAPPGNGKSMEQAVITYDLLREILYTWKKYPKLKIPTKTVMGNVIVIIANEVNILI